MRIIKKICFLKLKCIKVIQKLLKIKTKLKIMNRTKRIAFVTLM